MSAENHPHPNYKAIFLALLFFTIIEIFVANLPLPKFQVAAMLILFAVIKASLVAMFYMHLKFEKILLTLIAFSPLVFSVILVLLVGFDIRQIIHP